MARPTPASPSPGRPWWTGVAAALLLGACAGPQSTLSPAGPAALPGARLWWLFLALSTLVSVAVFAALLHALFRRRDFRGERPPLRLSPAAEAQADPGGVAGTSADQEWRAGSHPVEVRLDTAAEDRRPVRWVVGLGVGATGLIVLFLLVVTLHALGALSDRRASADLTIVVTGWQWWWEVHYLDDQGHRLFETANEIHVPVGKRVRVLLRAADVIHSFWVPQLAGKRDMIPGRTNSVWFRADREGVYRGQCAEYCAGPHALMSLLVIAQPEAEFRAWTERQRLPARPTAEPGPGGVRGAAGTFPQPEPFPAREDRLRRPSGPEAAERGREVFFAADCDDCHAIRGTPANGEVGPDLTHLASRRTLAAATVPNSYGHLGGWITSPQAIKPGSKMPSVPMDSEAMLALLAYLRSLE